MRNSAMVNGRITSEQMEWLQARADELGGNLSAALRQTITDARLLEMARSEYQLMRRLNPDFEVPVHDDEPPEPYAFTWILGGPKITESDDLALRKREAAGED
jgi:hypothetical protein